MTFFGLDEAALGPRLGPFCATLVPFFSSVLAPYEINLYRMLKKVITPEKDASNRLFVADSKKVYNPSRGIAELEHGIAVFLNVVGIPLPPTLHQLVTVLCGPADAARMAATPWYQENQSLPIQPLDNRLVHFQSCSIAASLAQMHLEFRLPAMRCVPAQDFNRMIAKHKGKSGAVVNILDPLLTQAFKNRQTEPIRIMVDRQGGRRYYGEWLASILPAAPIRILEETSTRSAYCVEKAHVEFLVSADRICLEVALASMFAKYLREVAMRDFNQYWKKQIDTLKPTAGYPRDANRFIAELKAAGVMPSDPTHLVRVS